MAGLGPPDRLDRDGLGAGYGSMAVAGDRVFVQGMRGGRSVVIALNRADGKEVWSKALGAPQTNDRARARAARRRSTATACTCSARTATSRASRPTAPRSGSATSCGTSAAAQLHWLISESPLVDGAHVIVSPGGPGAGMVKLDKMTGKTVWTSKDLSDPAGYSSVIAADVQGVRTYMTFTASGGCRRARVGRQADVPISDRREPIANITTPIFSNNKVFFTSAYGTGGGLSRLTAQNGERHREGGLLHARHEEPSRRRRPGRRLSVRIQRLDPDLPRVRDRESCMWRDRSVGKGSVTFADGHLYLQGENNVVGLAEASSAGYREKGRFDIPDKGLPSWAHPVVSDGRLYVRNQDTLLVYDIGGRAAYASA